MTSLLPVSFLFISLRHPSIFLMGSPKDELHAVQMWPSTRPPHSGAFPHLAEKCDVFEWPDGCSSDLPEGTIGALLKVDINSVSMDTDVWIRDRKAKIDRLINIVTNYYSFFPPCLKHFGISLVWYCHFKLALKHNAQSRIHMTYR